MTRTRKAARRRLRNSRFNTPILCSGNVIGCRARCSKNSSAYWKKQLTDAPTVLELPTNRPRPAINTYEGRRQHFTLSPQLGEAVKSLNEREGVTMFMTLLSAFVVLLHRYTAQTDIVVGTPVANRTRAETEALIGLFVNTLVLRTDVSDDPTFAEVLRRVRETSLDAYAHQDLPFEKIVEELQPKRDLSRTPVFQVLFAVQNAGVRHVYSVWPDA
jgi:hypothetical protein